MNNLENWIDKKKLDFSFDSKKLFEESILCYNIKAYRASLLFSYLGFLTFIKEIIIKSKKPDLIPEQRWQNLINKIRDEDEWEQKAFQELINSSNPIFNISDSVRQQIKYWKDRRNDCAHYKENIIDYNHVEMFWAFLKSNLSKITIEGGKANLLKKFQDHFDPTKTPPDKSYDSLIQEIENAIEVSELEDFFERINQIINIAFFYNDEKTSELYDRIFTLVSNENIRIELKKHIFSKPYFDLNLIFHQPKLITILNYTSEQIREIWIKNIYNLNAIKNGKHYILATLLRNSLIPKSQIKEAMQKYFDNFNQERFANIPNDQNLKTQLANSELLDIVYSEFIEHKQIEKMNFNQINAKADLIALLIEFKPISFEVISAIDNMYKNNINPYWFNESLENLFKTNTIKKNEYENLCSINGLEIPFE